MRVAANAVFFLLLDFVQSCTRAAELAIDKVASRGSVGRTDRVQQRRSVMTGLPSSLHTVKNRLDRCRYWWNPKIRIAFEVYVQSKSIRCAMPSIHSPQELLANEIREIYSAERQLSRVLPRLARKTDSSRLREMLDQRRERAAALIERLDEALEEMSISKGRQKNVAAEGLIDDMNHHLDEVDNEGFRDPLLLAAMQKIEHYCIAAWGTAAAMGRLLGEHKVAQAMERVLAEGKEFDNELTRLAEEEVNPRMMEGEGEEDEERDSDEDKVDPQGSSKRERTSRRGSR
jgi:ferritin-like metal-binding protein YciE